MTDTASAPRELLRLLRRHPRHLPERLVLFSVAHLAEPTRAWAARQAEQEGDGTGAGDRSAATDAPDAVEPHGGDDPRSTVERRLVHDTIVASRIDGAVAGTPLFLALVPAYVSFLWGQARMVLRIAALHGRDPGDPAVAAELLVLRGVHPTVEAAAQALARIEADAAARDAARTDAAAGESSQSDTGAREASQSEHTASEDEPGRRGWRERIGPWVLIVRRILVLAAFIDSSDSEVERGWPARVALTVLGLVIWLGTWVFPATFMVVMSWGCESSTRRLSALALAHYGDGPRDDAGGDAGSPADRPGRLARARALTRGRTARRRLAWTVLLALSLALPLAFIALAVGTNIHRPNWVRAIAPLAGLALVFALAARQRR